MKDFWKITQLTELLKMMKNEDLKSKVTLEEKYYREKMISLMKEAQEWGYEQGKSELNKR